MPARRHDGGDDPLAPIRKAAQGFGNVTKATVGTIQRQLLVLENQGGAKFFGEPALSLKDFMRTDRDGTGHGQHPGRRQADAEPAAVCDLPAVDAVGVV